MRVSWRCELNKKSNSKIKEEHVMGLEESKKSENPFRSIRK